MDRSRDIHADRAEVLLNFSPIQAAVDVTGREMSDPGVDSLAFHFLQESAAEKRALLSELTDTYWAMPSEAFSEVSKDAGFTNVLSYNEPSRYGVVGQAIFANEDLKLLLAVSTSGLRHGVVDSAMLYGTVEEGNDVKETLLALFRTGCGWSPVGETQFAFYCDVREGLKLKLGILEEANVVFTDWLEGKASPVGSFVNQYFDPLDLKAEQETRIRSSLPRSVKSFTKL